MDFSAGAAPAPKPNTRKYAITNDVVCMGKKVAITNLAEDKEGSRFVYIMRRIVSKNRLHKSRERESATAEQITQKTRDLPT